MTNDQIDIKTLPIEKAYEMFAFEIQEDDEQARQIYKLARYGIDTKFDIYDYLNGTIVPKQKIGIATLKGKTIELKNLWTELENRNKIKKKLKLYKGYELPDQYYKIKATEDNYAIYLSKIIRDAVFDEELLEHILYIRKKDGTIHIMNRKTKGIKYNKIKGTPEILIH